MKSTEQRFPVLCLSALLATPLDQLRHGNLS
jgi:hypothetical protein